MKKQALYLLFCLLSQVLFAQIKPLANAHAHNDYEHTRPLFDALEQGFTSVEADVYLVNGELYVSHNPPKELDTKRTLKELYLNPLQKIVKKNNGKVYAVYTGIFYLMIDFKTSANETYELLNEQLTKYPELQNNSHFVIFISGNRPIEKIRTDKSAKVGLDGRPADLGLNIPVSQMPVISDSFTNICKWNGKGEIPETERQKLISLSQKVHAEGKKLRLWASPDDANAWKVLMDVGVDMVNTDKLADLRKFLEKYQPAHN
ncbi:phosphatidylinositol-specific phospholipase C/glycerophosphodiester phosphodiesterase family protein [Xanthocytophaga agilis]|uniref:Altered inheritance of mitochondria protein 6 n=1 Tax=Xanthocytophaga agilis TaxID=3048010 RepID=A0AAE3R9C5_9BACT|nr:phosphatidylinositol-specific phospholipase C/glycerophosphodiester phosphodiesterase family protein [Xanthocytophaga agilis]MDJ1503952.1 phosphatidylinositol-specific phospholipase C/glycerophosphodiester phosphodiesterase family protein [Xanthocytophaga agilis]